MKIETFSPFKCKRCGTEIGKCSYKRLILKVFISDGEDTNVEWHNSTTFKCGNCHTINKWYPSSKVE